MVISGLKEKVDDASNPTSRIFFYWLETARASVYEYVVYIRRLMEVWLEGGAVQAARLLLMCLYPHKTGDSTLRTWQCRLPSFNVVNCLQSHDY